MSLVGISQIMVTKTLFKYLLKSVGSLQLGLKELLNSDTLNQRIGPLDRNKIHRFITFIDNLNI